MALTYEESAALMQDPTFRGRVNVANLKYSDSILSAPQAGQNALFQWAQKTIMSPDAVLQIVVPPTVLDAAVQELGAAIPDAQLQSAVEAVVNKII